MVLIQETKCNNTKLETLIACIWKGNNVAVVDANGALGGLAHIRRPQEVNLNAFLVTRNSILATFQRS